MENKIDKTNRAKLGSISMHDIENKNIDKNISEKERQIIVGKIMDIIDKRIEKREKGAKDLLATDPTGYKIDVKNYPQKQMLKEHNLGVKESMLTKFLSGEVKSRRSKTFMKLKRALGL